MKRLILKRLSFAYNSNTILDNISFTQERGEFISLIGPPGCGKTTLLSIIYGLLPVPEEMLANPFSSHSMLLHREALHFDRTTEENIISLSRGNVVCPDDAIRQFELEECRSYPPGRLPRELRKRIELAGAFTAGNELLILDEPFSGLKEKERQRLNIILKQAAARTQTTIIMVTHSISEACYHSERLLLLSSRPATIIKSFSIDKSETSLSSYKLSSAENEVKRMVKSSLTPSL